MEIDDWRGLPRGNLRETDLSLPKTRSETVDEQSMRIAIESKRKSEGLHQFDRPGFEIEHMRYRNLKRPSAVDRDRLVGAAISQADSRTSA